MEDATSPVFTDSDGDTLSYTATAQYPGILGTSVTGDHGIHKRPQPGA